MWYPTFIILRQCYNDTIVSRVKSPLENLKFRNYHTQGTPNGNKNTLGFPQREKKNGIIRRRSGTKVLAPFYSLNILFLRRGPSQDPPPLPLLQSVPLSIDSYMHIYEKTRRGWGGCTDTRISFDRPVGRHRSSPSRSMYIHAGCKFLRMQIVHREVCKCSGHVRPVFFEPFSAQHAEDDRERARYLHILDISSHCIGTIVPWVPGWDADSYVHDGSEPLIRISHWIGPVLGLTDCLECSQDRSFRLLNVFPTECALADVPLHQLY